MFHYVANHAKIWYTRYERGYYAKNKIKIFSVCDDIDTINYVHAIRWFAEEDSLSKNIQKIKTLFKIGDEYEHFDKHQYDDSNGKNITNLSWSGQNKHIDVDIDEEGNIVGYRKSVYGTDRNTRVYRFPKITKEQGGKVAKGFIKKLYPDILDKIKSEDEDNVYNIYRRNNLREYSYSFVRTENDILFNENGIHVSVDTQTGEVNSFNINWEKDLKFADTKGIISEDEAKKIYKVI